MASEKHKSGGNPISWMAGNHVAANLLMLLLLVGGIFTGIQIKQEVMPEVDLDRITISVAYPGAGPEEVEEGIILKIEDSISGLEGIKTMKSTSSEGSGTITLEVLESEDVNEVLQEVKSEVDRVTGLPEDAEEPVVRKIMRKNEVLSVAVYGDISEASLRQYAELIRDEILTLDNVTQVDLSAERPFEIAIEIPEKELEKYGLTLSDVAGIIAKTSIDLPAGTIRERGGEILLRAKQKRFNGLDYEDIIIVSNSDGSVVRLKDIAKIKDGFMDLDLYAEFDGKSAINLNIYRVGDQKPIDIADKVKKYVSEKKKALPVGVHIDIWYDSSDILKQRMELLMKNAYLGLALVIGILAIFLQFRLAFWVSMGIPISFLGGFIFLPMFDVSVNMISLFAFIMALGIVVDDAIIVGENIYAHRRQGKPPFQAAVDGTLEVIGAVTFSVLTTVAAFSPLMFVSGIMGKFIMNIPVVVIMVLLVSLVEAFFVLPAHLSGVKKPKEGGRREKFTLLVERFINGPVQYSIRLAVQFRYAVVALSLVTLIITVALMKSGVMKFRFFPDVEGDTVTVELTMPYGTNVNVTEKNTLMIMEKGKQLIKKYEEKYGKGHVLKNTYKVIGATFGRSGMRTSQGNVSTVIFYFHEPDMRIISTNEFAKEWRQFAGGVPGAESLTFTSRMMNFGDKINVRFAHKDFDVLNEVADRLKDKLKTYDGVRDIEDSYSSSKEEIRFRLTPEGRALGLTESDLARQVRAAFSGVEAMSFQRGRNEVEVNVMYPKEDRYSIDSLNNMFLRTSSGKSILFSKAAYVDKGVGYSSINRSDNRRVINITADAVAPANPEEILAELSSTFIPDMVADYQGLTWKLEGESERRQESMKSMARGFLVALFIIYALLAVPFKSYFQPFLVMAAIPFGIVGAILGHLIMGYNVSIMSIFGIVALSGVVVNDSLVLIVFVNKAREMGASLYEAVVQAGVRRFRPIILTSLTTFFGLFPMLSETSLQARFLIPMAISLAFGILFATIITIYLVPSMYLIAHEVMKPIRKFYGLETEESSGEPESDSYELPE